MKRLLLTVLFLLIIGLGQASAASVIGPAAAALSPGSWTTVPMSNVNLTSGLVAWPGSNVSPGGFYNGPQPAWDSTARKIYIETSDHSSNSKPGDCEALGVISSYPSGETTCWKQLWKYDDATDTWIVNGPFPKRNNGTGVTGAHTYGHVAWDDTNKVLYIRGYNSTHPQTMFRYCVNALPGYCAGQGANTWAEITGPEVAVVEPCCDAELAWHPTLNGGTLLYFAEAGGGSTGCGALYGYKEGNAANNGVWSVIDSGAGCKFSGPQQSAYAIPSPTKAVVMFGGGYAPNWWKIDASAVITRLDNHPTGCLLGTTNGMVSQGAADPVSGNAYFIGCTPGGQLWRLNPTAASGSQWTLIASNLAICTPNKFPSENCGADFYMTPISTYGVIGAIKFLTGTPYFSQYWIYKATASGGGDITPPTVSLTAPATGTVSGNITVSATAADNIGVVGVQFKIDGTATGTEDTISPYSISWNSTTASNGSHIITATARDSAGNSTTSTGVTVTVSNTVASADWATRCAGAVRCWKFDTNADLGGVYSGSIPYPVYVGHNNVLTCNTNGEVDRCPTIDAAVPGGGSALLFVIASQTGANAGGTWVGNFSDDYSVKFGGGQTFYVQWRQRFNCDFLFSDCPTATQPRAFVGAGGWKLADIATGDRAGGCTTAAINAGECVNIGSVGSNSSCTPQEIIVQNTFHRGVLQGYHGCPGTYPPSTSFGFEQSVPPSEIWLQNAYTGHCPYSEVFIGNRTNCVPFVADEWLTMKVRVTMGAFVAPNVGACAGFANGCYPNSTIEYWQGREGQSTVKTHSFTFTMNASRDGAQGDKYGKVWLLPYNTGKDDTASHPTGNVWYKELIVSTNDIADPSSTPDTTIPTVAITSPIPPTTSTTTSPIAVSGTATDNVGVTSVTWTCIACVTKGGTATSSPGTSISWSIPALDFVGAGSYTVNVVAHDAAGNVSTAASLIIAYAPSSTYWVRLTGTMSGCTPSTSAPATDAGYKSTIAAGIGCLAGGNTLNVRAGTYDVSIDTDVTDIPSGSPSNPTRIVSFDGPRLAILRSIATRGAVDRYVRFDGFKTTGATLNDQAAIVYNTSNFVTHTNFEIDGSLLAACTGSTPAGGCGEGLGAFGDNNTYSNGEIHNIHVKENDGGGNSGHGIYLHNSNNVVDNLYVHDVGGQGIQVYNSGSSSESNNTVKNSRWQNTKQSSGIGLSAIYLGNGTGNVAYNNIVYGNNYVGIQMGAACVNCAAYNNTVVGVTNQAFELYGGGQGTATAPILRNNLLSGNGLTFLDNGATSPVHDHNGCAVAGTWCDIVGAINFFNPGANDYRLTSQSTMAINSGATTPYPNDITGLLRPQGSAFDLGAYESTVVTGPPPVVTIVNPTSNATLSVGLPLFSFGGTSNLQ